MKTQIRNILVAAGLIRVDGMHMAELIGREEHIIEPVNTGEFRECQNNGKGGISLPEGEVWVGNYAAHDRAVAELKALGVVFSCQGFWIPFSNAESCRTQEWLDRLADPDCQLS